MKKFIFLSLLAFATMQVSYAQLSKAVADFKSETTGKLLDTVVNATTKFQQVKVSKSASAVYFQATATKISGTTAGIVRLFGSNDGIAWKRVTATGTLSAADSLNLANVATPQTIFFKDAPSQYLFYRVSVAGSGTASTQFRSVAVADQK